MAGQHRISCAWKHSARIQMLMRFLGKQLGMLMFIVANIVGSTIQITTLPLPVLSTLQAVRLSLCWSHALPDSNEHSSLALSLIAYVPPFSSMSPLPATHLPVHCWLLWAPPSLPSMAPFLSLLTPSTTSLSSSVDLNSSAGSSPLSLSSFAS